MVQIAVVNQGDSLWSIANQYGVSVNQLITLNKLDQETELVLGQAIVIPSSSRFFYEYTPRLKNFRKSIEVNAYIRPSTPNAVNLVNKYAPYLTYFSVSSYRVTASGDITTVNDSEVLDAIEKSPAVPILVVTNFTGEEFSPEITRQLFTNAQARDRFITNLIILLSEKNYFAVNIDFEENYPEDRELYNEFLRIITPRIREQGFQVSTTLAPKISPSQPVAWFGGLDHDYAAHGEIVDFVILMTYDIGGWFGGSPQAVSPLPTVREVINYATSVVPNDKILLGLPLYGYDWKLPFDSDVDIAETIGPQKAVTLAREQGAIIQYDYPSQAPFFNYYDQDGNEHIVWFEDARSMKAKLELINEYGLRGASYFILGRDFPGNWALLSEMFSIQQYK
ncbi:glycosyl hydrolase family 18 protein [Bacillaceae bacterium IKA-2]|nr:glycosyl hydrolase family 18 protein [Bacillaceae bacterium IKA-2]